MQFAVVARDGRLPSEVIGEGVGGQVGLQMEEEIREKEGLRTAQQGGIGLSKAPLGGFRHRLA